MVSVSNLIEHLRASAAVTTDSDVVSVATHYSAMLSQLLECLRSIYDDWGTYIEHYHVNRHATSYSAPVVRANPTGRQFLKVNFSTFVLWDFHGQKLLKFWEFRMLLYTEDDRNMEWEKNQLEV